MYAICADWVKDVKCIPNESTGGVAIPIRVGGKRVQESTAFVDLPGQTGCLRMKILFRC